MADQFINPEAPSIVRARKDDLLPILHLFNEAVVWLNQQGIDKQWGTESFSEFPRRQEQFLGWIEQETFFVARLDERIVGSLALNPTAPAHITSRWESFPTSAFSLEAFATTHALAGHNIGRALLRWAEQYTRKSGRTTIWLDCWGKNAAHVRYYQQMGFVPCGQFLVDAWCGQLFENQIEPGKITWKPVYHHNRLPF